MIPDFDHTPLNLVLATLIALVFLACQFLPAAVASSRRINGAVGVLVINLVGLGLWTIPLLGGLAWAGALVWAVSAKSHPKKKTASQIAKPKGYVGAKVMDYR